MLNDSFSFRFLLLFSYFFLIFIYTLIRETNGNRTLYRTMACSGNGAYDCLTNEMEKCKSFPFCCFFLFLSFSRVPQAVSSVLALTHNIQVAHLAFHWIRIYLAHVPGQMREQKGITWRILGYTARVMRAGAYL